MNKFASISIFICGVAIFAFSVALVNGAFDVPRMQTHIDIPIIPVDAPVNIETDGELAVEHINLPDVMIYGTPSKIYGTPSKITGAGAARRRAVAVEAVETDKSKLPGEVRFSTEAARNYRPSFSHSVRSVHLRANPAFIGKPTYRVPNHSDEPPIEIEIR